MLSLMDSGNSGSMQSSSTGGDEEYDSRAESSISAFLNNPPPPLAQAHVQFTSTATNLQQQGHMFDPLSNYLDPMQRSSASLVNLDMMWSKASRSEPNQTDLGGLIPCSISSSSSTQNQQNFLSSQLAGQTRGGVGVGVVPFPTTQHHSLQSPPNQSGQAHNTNANTNNSAANTNNNNMVRNPKKRSRASRRAPTTVLTTDTTNFRAMVQEFTGIPAPPFTSSPFPRTRLDLFGSSTMSMRSTSTNLDPPPPPYLLRPFAQKLHPFPPSSTSSIPSIVDALASNHSSSTNNPSTNSTSINYQLPLNVMNNVHNNSILNFQSILQPPPRYPLGNNNSSSSSLLGASKTQPPSLEIPNTSVDNSHHLKMGGVLEELGLSHAHVSPHVSGLHHNMVTVSSSMDGALSSRVNNNNNMRNPSSADWAQRSNNDGGHGHGGFLLGSLSATGNNNYNSGNIHGEKGPECGVAARSEGMVESWINCSSD